MTTTAGPESAPARGLTEPPSCRRERRALITYKLFDLACSCDCEVERRELLDQIIVMHLGLAHHLACQYRSRGVPIEDLRQVAALALTKATRRYDITMGTHFVSYAVPTIRGDLRRHFRDLGWMVRPPRRVQEIQARISAAETELTHRLGRSPRQVELAEHLDELDEAVIEALASDGCFAPASLDLPATGNGNMTVGNSLADNDAGHDAAEARVILYPLVRQLPDRDQQILGMRFFEGLTQREIADRIGVTQMQVSRLLTRILGQLRNLVGEVPLA